MVLIELPPQPNPKKETAHKPITTLGEHAIAFLNANNPKNWADYQPEEVTGLYTAVGELLNQRSYSQKELQTFNHTLRTGFLTGMGLSRVNEFIARVLGYKDWGELAFHRSPRGATENRNFGKTPTKVSAEAAASGDTKRSIFSKGLVRMAYLQKYRHAIDNLRKGCAGKRCDRLKLVMRELARALNNSEDLPEDWKEQDFWFAAVRDKDDFLTFRLIALRAPSHQGPFDGSQFYAEIKLLPVSHFIDTISDPQPSEKPYSQWREEFFSTFKSSPPQTQHKALP